MSFPILLHRIVAPLALAMSSVVVLCAQTPRERADALAGEAITAMEAGQIERAITLLDSAIALVPSESEYVYEKSYAYYLGNDPDRAIATLTPALDDTTATDNYYQLAATLHAARGDTSAAARIIMRGLELFPNSGRLYLERGNLEVLAGRFQSAVAMYERGMRVEPAFPSNYYRAALVLANSSEPIWGIVYGEIFMNIERATARTSEMGMLLLATYRRAISAGGDSLFAVRFSDNTDALHLSGSGKPELMMDAMVRPELAYEMTAMQALVVSDRCRSEGVSLGCLDQLRTEFVRRWFAQGLNEKYPSRLFDWHKVLLDVGFFDEYNYWLLGAGDSEAFYAWVDAKPDDFEHFQSWFRVNGMSLR